MIDNQRILRVRTEISATRETLNWLQTNPQAIAAELETRLEKLEADEREEKRKIVGQAHFLLDLIAETPRLRARLREIILGDPASDKLE